MSSIKDDIKKSLLILEGKEISSNEKVALKEHDLSDVASESDTKVEVLFKDNDEIEVEVYAKGAEELNRLMDLAGMFHREKQASASSDMGPDLNMDPVNTSSELADPTIDIGTDLDMGSALNMDPVDTDVDLGSSDSDLDTDIDIGSELDIPVENPLATQSMDVDFEMGEDRINEYDTKLQGLIGKSIKTKTGMIGSITDVLEPDETGNEAQLFVKWESGQDARYPLSAIKDVMDEDTNNSINETLLDEGTAERAKSGKRHDYGHPNPLLGEEPFDLDAHNFAGHASKQVRYVPSGSGDNAMDDPSNPKASSIRVKGLKEYIEEVENQNLDETSPPDEVLGAAKANIALNLNPATQKKIEIATDELGQKPGIANLDSEEMVDDVASGLTPRDADALKKGYDAAKASGDIEEARYRYDYSFRNSVLPFQGLSGEQRVKRGAIRAAKNGIKKSPGIFGK